MREEQTDSCHGTCADGCAACAGRFEINFRPMDIRTQFLMGGADPKLEGEGAPGGDPYQ